MTNPKVPDLQENTVYQIVAPGTRKRYVRLSEVHGEKPCACEIIYDMQVPESVGTVIAVAPERLCVPDQYPSSRFSPEAWKSRVSQSNEEKKREIAGIITAMVRVRSATASGLPEQDKKTVGAIRDLLKDKIGGFTLALFLGFVTKKIMETLPAKESEPRTFKQKLSEMHNNAAKKSAREATDHANRILQRNRDIQQARMLQNANHQGIV